MNKYDLIVIGAGTGGSIAAKTAAKMGYKVCLIDKKRKDEIGDKVCGDAIGKHHFDTIGITPPRGSELASISRGIEIYSPNLETCFRVEGEGLHGFMVNRLELGQRFLNEAIDEGVELLDKTRVLTPIIKNNFVQGVSVRNNDTSTITEYNGKLVIDASGMTAILRKQTPPNWGIEREILGEDIEVCYREIRTVSDIEEPSYLKIFLNQDITPGGYCWIFPKGERTVNVGLGIQMKRGAPNPKEQFDKHVLSNKLLNNSKKIRGQGGIVSTRCPISSMVGNGVLFVGDVACQPNPIHGGGIGPSMISGHLAAKIACEAIDKNDVSQTGLWSYNKEYMDIYGAKTASLYLFSIFLQKCTNTHLNYGMSNRLIKEEDILKASLGEDLKLNITEKALRVFRGLKQLSFLRSLGVTAEKMIEIKSMYQNFPDPQEHREWITKTGSILREMKEKRF